MRSPGTIRTGRLLRASCVSWSVGINCRSRKEAPDEDNLYRHRSWLNSVRWRSEAEYRRAALHEQKQYLEQLPDATIGSLVAQNYRLLDFLVRERDEARSRTKALSRKMAIIKELNTLPGYGPILSSRFVAYVQTPHRFRSESELFNYSRLAVVDRSSDGKPLGYKRLDRSGNGSLKDVSRKAFDAAMRCKGDNYFKRFYRQSCARTKNPMHARLNTQRKILSVALTLWKKGIAYDDNFDLKKKERT